MKINSLYFLIVSLFVAGCYVNEPRTISFKNTFRMFDTLGILRYQHVYDIRIVESDSLTLFIVPHRRGVSEMKMLANGDMVDGPETIDTIYKYYFIGKGEKTGIKFDSLNAVSGKRFSVDSLLPRMNLGSVHLRQNASAQGKLIFSSKDKYGNLLSEEFVSDRDDEVDTTFRLYDHSMKDISFSMAPELEQKTGTKLKKLIWIMHFDPREDQGIERKVDCTEVSRIKLEKKEDVSRLFMLYEKEKLK